MGRWELLESVAIADCALDLEGRTLDDLFRAAAEAFTETLTDAASIEPRESIPLALEAPAVDLLLIDWLNEILYRFDVHQLLVGAVEVRVDAAVAALHGTLRGEPFDTTRHRIKVLVKAVTYHALEVRQDQDGWHATVVFDI